MPPRAILHTRPAAIALYFFLFDEIYKYRPTLLTFIFKCSGAIVKAIVCRSFAPIEALKLEEIAAPQPAADGVPP